MTNRGYSTHLARRDYLVGKYVDGAMAMRDFFDRAFEDESLDSHDIAREVASKYDVTPNQRKYLDAVVERVGQAKEIVGLFKKRYGVNQRGMFRDKEEVYRLVFDEEPPKGYFSAEPQSFVVKFKLPPGRFREAFGYQGSSKVNLNPAIREFRKKLREGGINLDLPEIVYRINYKSIRKEMSVMRRLFGGSLYKQWVKDEQMVEDHEKKHCIDALTSNLNHVRPLEIVQPRRLAEQVYPIELSARLFVGRKHPTVEELRMEIGRDAVRFETNFDKLIARANGNMGRMNSPFLKEHEKRRAEKLTKKKGETVRQANEIPLDVFGRLYQNGVDARAASYMVSTTPLPKLKRRLEMVDAHSQTHSMSTSN